MGVEEKVPEEKAVEKKQPNVKLIFTSVLAILFLAVAVFSYLWKEQEHSGRVNAEKKLEQSLVAKKAVEQNLKETLQKNGEMTGKMKELESQMTEAQDKLSASEEEKLALTESHEKDQARIKELEENLQAEQKDKEVLAKDLEQFKTQYTEAEEKRADLEKEKIALEAQLKSSQAKETEPVELGKITVTSPTGTATPSPRTAVSPLAKGETTGEVKIPTDTEEGKSGRILVVNDEFNFVVVSFGKNDGLKGGEILSIYREGQFLGKVQVEKLYDAISAATILDGKTGLYKEGDVVKL